MLKNPKILILDEVWILFNCFQKSSCCLYEWNQLFYDVCLDLDFFCEM
jgi:hypothetical protein